MRALITADIHIQSTGSTRSAKDRIQYSEQLALDISEIIHDIHPDYFINLGDLWTPKHRVEPDTLRCVSTVLDTLSADTPKCKKINLIGNHDYHNRWLYDILRHEFTTIKDFGTYIKCDNDKTACFFIPWMPEGEYRVELTKAHRVAKDYQQAYLFTHISIKEGKPSGDYCIDTPIGLADLQNDLYNMVITGDYHTHQTIDENVIYVGAPYPMSYNDSCNPGLFLLDTEKDELESIALPSYYPKFHTVYMYDNVLPYVCDSRDYLRIYCSGENYEKCIQQYPMADVIPSPVKGGSETPRVSIDPMQTESDRIQQYVTHISDASLNKESLIQIGVEYVRKVI